MRGLKTKTLVFFFSTLSLLLFSSELLAATVIENTQTISGSIVEAHQMDTYTFTAKSDDVVTVLMAHSGTSLDPQVELHGPNGNLLAEAHDGTGYGASATIETYNVSADGTFFIVCRSYSGTRGGTYNVSLWINGQPLVLTPDTDGGQIANTQTKSGTVELADLDVWTFDAESGDAVTVLMAHSGTSLDPYVKLYGAEGNFLTEAYNGVSTGGSSATIEAYIVSITGTFSIVSRSYSGYRGGDYNLSIWINGQPLVLTPDTEGGFIADAQTKSCMVSPYGDLDVLMFSACQNDIVSIEVSTNSNSLDPQIEIYKPDKLFLEEAYSGTSFGGTSTAINSLTLPQNGNYSILCRSYRGHGYGDYNISLSLSGSSSPPNMPSSPTPEDGAIDVPVDTDLSWVGGGPDPEGIVYDLSFGTSASPSLIATDLSSTTFDPGILASGKTYYWKIVSKNNCYMVEGPLWQFNTPMAGNISGQIGTDITGQDTSIVGATITILETGQSVVTDIDGNYLLSSVPVGDNYTIAISKKYFTTRLVPGVSVLQDQTTPVGLQQMDAIDCDMAADGKIGLEEAINALQTVTGIRSE